MDLLTDLLQQAGLHRRLLDLRHLAPGAALRFPCERSIGLHVVRQGPVYLHADSAGGTLALGSGDIALMARGCTHVLSLQPTLPDAATLADATAQPTLAQAGQPGAAAQVISGAYQLWHQPLHPFLQQLPAWFVLRADELPRLGPLALALGLLTDELAQDAPGARAVVHGLMDVVFSYLLRELLRRQAPGSTGWGQALRDPPVHRALALLQADCAHPWTLDSLAAAVGLSRTGLAQRFRQALGDTPLSHLRTLRMQQAMRLLGETTQTLEQVATAVGYQDAFSFSKVFKREVGLSPREFRRQDAAARQLPWRFVAEA
ncbi:MAG: AraC family transcriptional regulator [Aquabacterium sp.]|nr:AraC family transcriptional regulator [Aquabacterium sp.]